MANKMAQKPKAALEQIDFDQFIFKAEKALYAGKENTISVRDLQLWRTRLGAEMIDETIIPRRTLMRRKAKKEKLSMDETDKALRVARITIHAQRVFHGAERAKEWLLRKNPKFGGQPPYLLLKSDLGSSLVEETLLQIEHGIFA